MAQGSYSIYVLFANDTGDAGQIHKRRSTLENPANPWLKVHVLASMDKLWQIFPGKWSKGKKKATKLGSFLVKKWSQCQWQASKAHVRLSRAAFHAYGCNGFSLLNVKGEAMSPSSEVVGVSRMFWYDLPKVDLRQGSQERCYLSLFSCFSYFSFVHLLRPQFCIHSFLSHVPSLSLLLFLHPSLPPSFPGCLYPAAFLLSLFQGWWLWLESLHRWQASLPSGEGLHSLNFLHFSSFLLLFSSAQTFGLQLFTSGEPLSQRAWCEREGRVLEGGGISKNAWAVLRSIGAISISEDPTERPVECQCRAID